MTTALDIVPLNTVKDSLRIERDDTEQDELLTAQIQAAVEFTEGYTGRKFVDLEVDRLVSRPRNKILYHRDPSIDTSTVVLTNNTETITPSRTTYKEGSLFLWEPDGGWPQVDDLEYPYYCLTFTRKVEMDQFPVSLQQACIVLVRQLYDGLPEMKANSVYELLASPHVVYLQD